MPVAYGGTQRLPRIIGRGPALELLLTGRQITLFRSCDASEGLTAFSEKRAPTFVGA